MTADTSRGFPCPQQTKVQYYVKIQLDESSEVDENSVVDISSKKLVDESSVLVENTGLQLEELDEKAVVDQSVFSRKNYVTILWNFKDLCSGGFLTTCLSECYLKAEYQGFLLKYHLFQDKHWFFPKFEHKDFPDSPFTSSKFQYLY